MKLTFNHGLDDFRWNNQNQPAPGRQFRDTGIEFWLDGEHVESVRKSQSRTEDERQAADALEMKIRELSNEGMSRAQIRDHFKMLPQTLPNGVEL